MPSPDPYSPLIAAAIAREFPTQLVSGQDELVDVVTTEILGSKQQRYGPKPNAESQVAIREVIRFNVNQGTPIPFLVPWGSMKADYSSVDLAELWGLKTLRCLNARVAGHYAPGATFNIRVEDASAPNIFYDRAEEARAASAVYADDFIAMMEILELYPMIQIVRESLHVTEEEFTAEAETILPVMQMVLSDPANIHAHKQLGELGWKGAITDNMKRFYFTQYDKLYPGDPNSFVVRKWFIDPGSTEPRPDMKSYAIAPTLKEARCVIPEGMTRIERFPNDDPAIAEVWI